jgi:hypothetical protein
MDQIEELLRAEFGRGPGQPGAERHGGARAGDEEVRALVGLIRRRRRRRAVTGTLATVAAVAAVLSVGAVVGGIRSGATDVDPATRPAGAGEATVTSWSGVLGGAPVAPVGGDFADPDHGFLLVARCETSGAHFCRAELAVTADGGARWSTEALPVQPTVLNGPTIGLTASVSALGPRAVLYDRPAISPAAHRRFISTDGGATWRELSLAPSFTVSGTAARPADCAAVTMNDLDEGAGFRCVRADGSSAKVSPGTRRPHRCT